MSDEDETPDLNEFDEKIVDRIADYTLLAQVNKNGSVWLHMRDAEGNNVWQGVLTP